MKNSLVFAVVALVIGACGGYWLAPDKYLPYEADRNGSHMMPDGTIMPNMNNSGATMGQMMHDMNAALRGKTGDAFDKAFLEEMIVHHEGAVDMAKLVLSTSKRPELLKLANDIISAQTKEIEMMKAWEKSWFVK